MKQTDAGTIVAKRDLIDVSQADVKVEPYPHIIKQGFLNADLYQALIREFPSDALFEKNSKIGGRAGRDLYRGDPAYDELMQKSEAWQHFNSYINSPAYVEFTLDLFGGLLGKFDCIVDPNKASFCDHLEGREVLADSSRLGALRSNLVQKLKGAAGKDDLFVRLDLGQAAVGYGKSIHCDRPNRLTSMLIYFCDADEIKMEGGELIIHEHLEKKPYRKYERHPKEEDTREIMRFRPKHNLGIFFMCSNNSYHSATAVTAQSGYRNFAYISVSSKASTIW